MKAALYARVSTKDKGQDPEVQLGDLRQSATRPNWETTEFVDVGISGAKDSRPQLDLMLQACRRRKFDVVMVASLDRFARSVKQLVLAVEEFDKLGIQFISLREQLDTTTGQGRLIFHIFAAIAEFERELIRSRVLAGIATARARGVQLGRRRVLLNGPQIASLRAQGLSWKAIAAKLKVGVGTVYRAAQKHSKNLVEND